MRLNVKALPRERIMHWIGTGLVAATIMAAPAMAADTSAGSIELSRAWTPAVAQTRGDAPLYMTITNHGDAPDSLTRVRCPSNLADLTEKHATDRGEGGSTMREVKSFAVPAGGTVTRRRPPDAAARPGAVAGGPDLHVLNRVPEGKDGAGRGEGGAQRDEGGAVVEVCEVAPGIRTGG
jgi:hypothetical protein